MPNQKLVSSGGIYKGKTSMWLYIFHRVTGVALFGYLLLHIISTSLILLGPEIYEGAEAIYKNFYFRIAEIGLFGAVLAHAINGLRITYLIIGIILGGRLGYIIFYNFSYFYWCVWYFKYQNGYLLL